MTKKITIDRICLENIFRFEKAEFDVGEINFIEGKNNIGKTSILEAIKAMFKGGHDATLLRHGSTKGEIVFVLNNGQELTLRLDSDKTERTIRENGKKVGGIADIKSLINFNSLNPVEFIFAEKKSRINMLLSAMPIVLDEEILEKAVGRKVSVAGVSDGLGFIDSLRKSVYDERTINNGALNQAKIGLERTLATMPVVDSSNMIDATELQDEIDRAALALRTKEDGIKQKIDSIVTAKNREIEELEKQVQSIKLFISEQTQKANMAISQARSDFNNVTFEKKQQIKVAKDNAENILKLKIAEEQIIDSEAEIESLDSVSIALSKNIANLDQYKKDLLDNLPIKGLSFKDDTIYFEGTPFDRLNTARKTLLAFTISTMTASGAPVICVDGIESLDSESIAELASVAAKMGVQLFTTRVNEQEMDEDEELRIRSIGDDCF